MNIHDKIVDMLVYVTYTDKYKQRKEVIIMETSINYNERLTNLMARRRELSTAKRLESMRKRLHVNIGGFKVYYEEI
jgi:hypothetical protein